MKYFNQNENEIMKNQSENFFLADTIKENRSLSSLSGSVCSTAALRCDRFVSYASLLGLYHNIIVPCTMVTITYIHLTKYHVFLLLLASRILILLSILLCVPRFQTVISDKRLQYTIHYLLFLINLWQLVNCFLRKI